MIGWTLFVINLLLDVLAVWYIKELLIRFRQAHQNSNDLYVAVEEYSGHLQKVYDLETYYGDSTLSGLLAHTRDLKEDLEVYKDMFSIDDTTYPEGSTDNDDNDN